MNNYTKHSNPVNSNTVLNGEPLISDVYLMDCMELMKQYPDNYFDLAVVDPPYGLGYSTSAGKKSGEKYGKSATSKRNYDIKEWDNSAPNLDYFNELIRVSKNQIIWGANHFISKIPFDSSCWIVWDKNNSENNFADCELAWTSFNSAVRKLKYTWHGMIQENMKNKEQRFHPTQKPVALYDWIFKNYTSEGMTILDTHLGSGSSRIAANKAKLHFVACELDADYFNAQNKRYEDFISQLRIV